MIAEVKRLHAGPHAPGEPAPDVRELGMRLTLAERAIAESVNRISELTRALGELAGPRSADSTPEIEPIVIGADNVSPFSLGFYQRETDKSGRQFRWTGRAEMFEFRLKVGRNAPRPFRLEVQPNSHVNSKGLRGFVDFVEIPLLCSAGGKFIIGVIPEKPFAATATLSFLLPNTFVPAEANAAKQDSRKLGLVFFELRVDVPGAISADDGSETDLADEKSEAAPVPNRRRAERTGTDGDQSVTRHSQPTPRQHHTLADFEFGPYRRSVS